MRTLKDIGRVFKQQNPDYRDLSDEDCGRILKKARPEFYADVVEMGMVTREATLPQTFNLPGLDITYNPNQQIESATELVKFFKPNQWRITSYFKTLQAQSRTRHLQALTPAIIETLRHGAMLEEAALSSQKKHAEFQSWIAQNQLTLLQMFHTTNLMQMAAAEGLTIDGLEEKRLADVRARNEEARMNLDTENKIRLAQEEFKYKEKWEERIAEIKKEQADYEHNYNISRIQKEHEHTLAKSKQEHDLQLAKEKHDHDIKMEEYNNRMRAEIDREVYLATEQLKLDIIEAHLTKQQEMTFIQQLIAGQYAAISEAKKNTLGLLKEEVDAIVEGHMRIIKMYEAQQMENHHSILQPRQIR